MAARGSVGPIRRAFTEARIDDRAYPGLRGGADNGWAEEGHEAYRWRIGVTFESSESAVECRDDRSRCV